MAERIGVVGIGLLGSEWGGHKVRVVLVGDNNSVWVGSACIGQKSVVGVVSGEWVKEIG